MTLATSRKKHGGKTILIGFSRSCEFDVPSLGMVKPGKSSKGKLNIALIGSGVWNARQPYEQGCSEENLMAFCDGDSKHCAENLKNWNATQPFFEDFRVMFNKMQKEIDAVVVSTPDHTHIAATLAAMERGIHVCAQEPLSPHVPLAPFFGCISSGLLLFTSQLG